MKHVYLLVYNAGVIGVYRNKWEADRWAAEYARYDYKGIEVKKYPLF